MSLNSIMNTASSGMMAAQTGLRVVSDNIANVNTKGYVRKTIAQSNLISNGMGVGVNIDAIKRATDRFLQSASLNAVSDSGRASALSEALNTAQNLFGDPSGDNSYFGKLDDIFSAFSKASDDPSSTLLRTQALTRVDDFLGESSRITAALSNLGKDADNRIASDIERVNEMPGLDTDPNAEVVAFVKALAGRNDHAKVAFGTEAGLFTSRADIPTVVCGPGAVVQAFAELSWRLLIILVFPFGLTTLLDTLG